MKKSNKVLSLVMVLALVLSFTACGSKDDGVGEPLVIYDGQFTEMKLVHRMAKMLVEDHTDLTVEIKDEMSPVNSFQQLVDGKADMMNSYDGTLLTTFLHLDTPDIPDGTSLYDFANDKAMERHEIRLLDKFGSENTYGIGVLTETAEKYNLKTISDLAEIADEIVFGAGHDFYTEEGSMKYTPFIEFYGLNFKDNKPIDINLKYSAIESGNIQATTVYTTDGMNKKINLFILEDDQKFFPEYNTALLVRNAIFEEYSELAPNLEEVLNKLGGQFTNEIMTDLTYEVDVEGRDEDEVVREFLIEKGLISE